MIRSLEDWRTLGVAHGGTQRGLAGSAATDKRYPRVGAQRSEQETELVQSLPPERVAVLLQAGDGVLHDPAVAGWAGNVGFANVRQTAFEKQLLPADVKPELDMSSYIDPGDGSHDSLVQMGRIHLEYGVSSRTLTVASECEPASYTIPATSGRGAYMNDALSSNRVGEGPIPASQYSINAADLSEASLLRALARSVFPMEGRGDWGSFRVPITPHPETNVMGRRGFYLHGGAVEGSAGCIDVGGGYSGDAITRRLVRDIVTDPRGTIPLTVW